MINFNAILNTVTTFAKAHKKELIGAAAVVTVGGVFAGKKMAKKKNAPALPAREPVQMEMDIPDEKENA